MLQSRRKVPPAYRIRREDVSGPVAHVSASYTYDRFFGFYGRGRRRYTYTLVLEDGEWRIELVEQLDQESRSNRNRRVARRAQSNEGRAMRWQR